MDRPERAISGTLKPRKTMTFAGVTAEVLSVRGNAVRLRMSHEGDEQFGKELDRKPGAPVPSTSEDN